MSGSNLITDFRGFLLQAAGYQNLGARTVTDPANKAIAETDFTIINKLDTPAIITYVLPAPSAQSAEPGSRRIRIIDGAGDAATHAITIDGNGANINGSATIQITSNWGYVDLEWLGTFWHVLNSLGATADISLPLPVASGGLGNGTGSAASLNNIPAANLTGNVALARIATALAAGGGPIAGTVLTPDTVHLSNTTPPTPAVLSSNLYRGTIAGSSGLTIQNALGGEVTLANESPAGTSRILKGWATFTLASGASTTLNTGGFGGHLTISNPAAPSHAVYSFKGDGTASLNGVTFTGYTATIGNAATTNLGANAGSLQIQNNTAGSVSYLLEVTQLAAV